MRNFDVATMAALYFACAAAFAVELDTPLPSPPSPATAIPQTMTYDEARVDTLVAAIQTEILVHKKMDRAKLLVVAANQGSARACNLIGWMFDNGVGVTKNSGKALKWFESCSRRSAIANYNAGVLYFEGRGVEKDTKKAVERFTKAWSFGISGFRVPQIPVRLAYYYRKQQNNSAAWEWAERAAEVNGKHGKYLVARMLIDQTAPISDDAKAMNSLEVAANNFSAPAALLMAWCYGTGRFTDKDYILAHQYDAMAYKFNPRVGLPVRWIDKLNDEDKAKAEAMANNWLSYHKQPQPLDFAATFNGTEDHLQR